MIIESETTEWQCEGDYGEKLLVLEYRGGLGDARESLDTPLQPFSRN